MRKLTSSLEKLIFNRSYLAFYNRIFTIYRPIAKLCYPLESARSAHTKAKMSRADCRVSERENGEILEPQIAMR